jgi:hypothetical protein
MPVCLPSFNPGAYLHAYVAQLLPPLEPALGDHPTAAYGQRAPVRSQRRPAAAQQDAGPPGPAPQVGPAGRARGGQGQWGLPALPTPEPSSASPSLS